MLGDEAVPARIGDIGQAHIPPLLPAAAKKVLAANRNCTVHDRQTVLTSSSLSPPVRPVDTKDLRPRVSAIDL